MKKIKKFEMQIRFYYYEFYLSVSRRSDKLLRFFKYAFNFIRKVTYRENYFKWKNISIEVCEEPIHISTAYFFEYIYIN